MTNDDKASQPRFWRKWHQAGAMGNFESAYDRLEDKQWPGPKSVEQARLELLEFSPDLLKRVTFIELHGGGVQMRLGNTSIISNRYSQGGPQGLYEIKPRINGRTFEEAFRTTDEVSGWLPLKNAIGLAVAAEDNLPILPELVAAYFKFAEKKTG